jgi:hypothetical protein
MTHVVWGSEESTVGDCLYTVGCTLPVYIVVMDYEKLIANVMI